jgi:hypothetical protein
MSKLCDILEAAGDGSVPGAVGLVARGGRVEVQAVGRGFLRARHVAGMMS